MAKIKVALIGLGWVGTNRHLKAIKKVRSLQLNGIIDRNVDSVTKTAKKLRIENYSTDCKLSSIPWIGDIDLLVISTPPAEHYPLMKEALELGLHVLTEKPLTLSIKEANNVRRLSTEKKATSGGSA